MRHALDQIAAGGLDFQPANASTIGRRRAFSGKVLGLPSVLLGFISGYTDVFRNPSFDELFCVIAHRSSHRNSLVKPPPTVDRPPKYARTYFESFCPA